MKAAVLGYGTQGASALEYWQKQGYEVTVCDNNQDLEVPEGVAARLGDSYLQGLEDFDLIIRSPSVHPSDILKANPSSADILQKVTTNTNEFMKACPSRNIIGVTGTKGKGTTSSLITKMLEADGKTVHLGGNIGIPPLEMLKDGIAPDDWVVLELANFQLIDIKSSPPIAVCVMVEPEHQDWHADAQEYVTAKQQLFRWQKPGDVAVFYPKSPLSVEVTSVSQGQKIPYFEEPGALVLGDKIVINGRTVCDLADIKLPGKHNWQNVCAAVTAVWQITQNVEAINSAIKNFAGLPFRLELVGEVGGVKFYNDSFGTTPETAIVAVEAFSQPKILILGGSDKGSDYTELAGVVAKNNVKAVVAIGQTGSAISAKLREQGFTNIIEGGRAMPEIVKAAQQQAQEGDLVILSTASASFGLFKNYKDRGEQFNQAVQSLA